MRDFDTLLTLALERFFGFSWFFQPSLKIEAIGVADIRRAEWKPRFKS